MSTWIALGMLVAAGIVLVVRHDAGTVAGLESGDFAGLVSGLALLIFIGASAFWAYRGRAAAAMRHAVMWLALGLVLMTVYSYRGEFRALGQRLAGELIPGMPISLTETEGGRQSVRIRRQSNGHFIANGQVNGQSVKLVIDTGATTVVLRAVDAQSIGIDINRLSYTVPVSTANGTTLTARVRLRSVAIGSVARGNVSALIAQPGALGTSLLGMSFLSRLRSYEVSGDFLTLRG